MRAYLDDLIVSIDDYISLVMQLLWRDFSCWSVVYVFSGPSVDRSFSGQCNPEGHWESADLYQGKYTSTVYIGQCSWRRREGRELNPCQRFSGFFLGPWYTFSPSFMKIILVVLCNPIKFSEAFSEYCRFTDGELKKTKNFALWLVFYSSNERHRSQGVKFNSVACHC